MTASPHRSSRNWTAFLAWALLLLVAGAALAIWGLSQWQGAAQFLGVSPKPPTFALRQAPDDASLNITPEVDPATQSRIATLEGRIAAVEDRTRQTAGSVGRADALLIAFASRRAVERGVSLGYLETLLTQRFGPTSPRAVATIISASRQPVTLPQLLQEFRALEPALRRGPPDEGMWRAFQREMGSLIAIHRASAPSPMVEARYDRALANLERGEVDTALAETMRLPGAVRAQAWATKARRYIAARRALDEIEGAALLSSER